VDIVTDEGITGEVAPRLEERLEIIPMVIRRELNARRKNSNHATRVGVLIVKQQVITKKLAKN
jgi:hypothetical protein